MIAYMFLDLDKKERGRIAAVDDSGRSVTYGDLCDFSQVYAHQLPSRSLIFILSENRIGSLLGYVASLSNRIVPLILSAATEEGLFNSLFEFRFQYIHLFQSLHSWFISCRYLIRPFQQSNRQLTPFPLYTRFYG